MTQAGAPVDSLRADVDGVSIVPVNRTSPAQVTLAYRTDPDPGLPVIGGTPSGDPVLPLPDEVETPLSPMSIAVPLQIPPGRVTFTCLNPAGEPIGAPATVSVSDPQPLWVEPAWEGVGCRPGRIDPLFDPVSGTGATSAGAAQELTRRVGGPEPLGLPRAVRMHLGYPSGQPEYWLLVRVGSTPPMVVTIRRVRTSTATLAAQHVAAPVTECDPIPGRRARGPMELLDIQARRLAATLIGMRLDVAVDTAESSGFTTHVFRPQDTSRTLDAAFGRIILRGNASGTVVRAEAG